MKVIEFLKKVQSPSHNIKVCGCYKHGLVDLYEGTVNILLKLYDMHIIMKNKNWGGLDEEKCFILMDVDTLSGDKNSLWISVKMPDTYTNKDSNGKILDKFIK